MMDIFWKIACGIFGFGVLALPAILIVRWMRPSTKTTQNKYDDASWHYDTTDAKLDQSKRWELACGHIVVYFKWCVERGLINVDVITDEDQLIAFNEAMKSGNFTNYFIDCCDCKLLRSDLNEDGQLFTDKFYKKYYDILGKIANDHLFIKTAEEYDFVTIANELDKLKRESA